MTLPLFDGSVLFACAFIAGAINSVAGGGTFLTFPVMLMLGMPPVAANATSCVALWPGSIASNIAYRAELAANRARLPALLTISILGGFIGAVLLLRTPDVTFAGMVPYLLLAATLLFAFGRRLTAFVHTHAPEKARHPLLVKGSSYALQFAIALYGGFFGAGIGILMLAMLELMNLKHIHQMNALKTLLATAINGIAVVTFIVAGAVLWPQALTMMAGAIAGGYGGAMIARRLPPEWVRYIVIVIGAAMTAYFFLR